MKLPSEGGKPLIPDVRGLTAAVREALSGDSPSASLLEVIDGHFKEDGRETPTVEDMLSHVRALRAVAGAANVRGLSAEQLDRLDSFICNKIHDEVDAKLPSSNTPYHDLARWIEAARRDNPVELFTSNYDELVEQALEQARVPYFDGFAGSRTPFFDPRAMEEDQLPARWARLWKVHGSISWYHVDGGVIRATADGENALKRVIHPSYLKYQESRRMPYLAMMDRLRAFLRQPNATLVVCGYSFRDEHINEVIIQGLEATPTAIAFALLYGELSGYGEATKLANGRANLSVLARDAAILSTRQCIWTERDGDSDAPPAQTGLDWQIQQTGDQPSRFRAAMMLGDFTVLGAFLRELVGPRTSEVSGGS